MRHTTTHPNQTTNPLASVWGMPVVGVTHDAWAPALRTLHIQPVAPQLPRLIAHPLVRRHQQVLQVSAEQDLGIEFLGYSALFTETRLYEGDMTDWAIMNLSSDPLYYQNGQRLVLPAANKAHIERIRQAGLDFDAVYIAHELPKGRVRRGASIPLELIAPPPPPEVMQRARFMGMTTTLLWKGVKTFIRGAVTTSGVAAKTAIAAAVTGAVVGAAAVGTATAAAGALLTLDPILFGVNLAPSWKVDSQPMGMWYYLTHWWWPPQEVER